MKDCLLILPPPFPFVSQLVLEIWWNNSYACSLPLWNYSCYLILCSKSEHAMNKGLDHHGWTQYVLSSVEHLTFWWTMLCNFHFFIHLEYWQQAWGGEWTSKRRSFLYWGGGIPLFLFYFGYWKWKWRISQCESGINGLMLAEKDASFSS